MSVMSVHRVTTLLLALYIIVNCDVLSYFRPWILHEQGAHFCVESQYDTNNMTQSKLDIISLFVRQCILVDRSSVCCDDR
jgi:hypothetical protein